MSGQWLVHIVADYAAGDLAFSELITALAHYLDGRSWTHKTTTVPNFDTLGAGFIVAQLALAEKRPGNMLVFANCAPRRDMTKARRDNAGEKLAFARLSNGVPVFVVNAGYSLSFLKPHLAREGEQAALWAVKVDNAGTQFRSRDRYPEPIGALIAGDLSFLGRRFSLDSIPDYPRGVVVYRDNFLNIKTTWREGDDELRQLRPGMQILLRINDHVHEAVFSDGSFNVAEGQLAFAPGSSGFAHRFYEVFLRGGHAGELFAHPSSESRVEFSLAGRWVSAD